MAGTAEGTATGSRPVPRVEDAATPVALESEAAVRRVGFVLLSSDLTTERDAAAMLGPEGIAAHVARIAFENPTTPENLRRMAPKLTEATERLVPGAPLSAVCFGCTSGTIEIGAAAVAEAIRAVHPEVAVVTPPEASLAAFAALGVRRVALLTPYVAETTVPLARYMAGSGLALESALCLGMEDDRLMARVAGESIVEAALEADRPGAEAIFISCTALPAMAVVPEIERRTGKPVVTSNLACLWRLRRLAGLGTPLPGFGRLLSRNAGTHPATGMAERGELR